MAFVNSQAYMFDCVGFVWGEKVFGIVSILNNLRTYKAGMGTTSD